MDYKFKFPQQEVAARVDKEHMSFFVDDEDTDSIVDYLVSVIVTHTLIHTGKPPKIFDASDSMF